jgi:hypothetical protein
MAHRDPKVRDGFDPVAKHDRCGGCCVDYYRLNGVGCGALIKLSRDHFRRRWTAGATPLGCDFNRQKQRFDAHTHTRSYHCALRLCYTVSNREDYTVGYIRRGMGRARHPPIYQMRTSKNNQHPTLTARSRLHPPTASAALRRRTSFTTPVCVSLPTTVKRRRLADRDRSDRHLTHKGGMS